MKEKPKSEMSDAARKALLKQVWDNCSFDEIINAGFEMNKCGAIDLKVAADEFANPEQEYSNEELEEEIKAFVKDADIDVIIEAILEKHNMEDIIRELNEWDVLDCFDSRTLLDFIDGTYALQDLCDEKESAGWIKGYEDAKKDIKSLEHTTIKDMKIDDKWKFLCNKFDISYYDVEGFITSLNELFEEFNKSSYKLSNRKITLTYD